MKKNVTEATAKISTWHLYYTRWNKTNSLYLNLIGIHKYQLSNNYNMYNLQCPQISYRNIVNDKTKLDLYTRQIRDNKNNNIRLLLLANTNTVNLLISLLSCQPKYYIEKFIVLTNYCKHNSTSLYTSVCKLVYNAVNTIILWGYRFIVDVLWTVGLWIYPAQIILHQETINVVNK